MIQPNQTEFYIEETEKNNNRFGAKRTTIDLPLWFNEETLEFIFETNVRTFILIELEHAVRIRSHFNLSFDFDKYDYILWRKPK